MQNGMYSVRDILTPADMARAEALLQAEGLQRPNAVEYGVGVYSGATLAATGFLGAGRLMGLCVASAWRGEGLALLVVDHLLKEAMAAGYAHLFIFTKAAEATTFAAVGFELLTTTTGPDGVALLEWGRPCLGDWLQTVAWTAEIVGNAGITGTAETAGIAKTGKTVRTVRAAHTARAERAVGAVVVNANPLTRGHVYLLEQAAAQCDTLYVFVVQEDVSAFPFAHRLALVRQGTAHLPRCHVVGGGAYIISQHIFPSYFTGEAGKAAAHAALDVTLFARRIAPALGITARFVGSEPLSPVTALYNAALRDILPAHGIALHELPRLEAAAQPVSASRVRALLAAGDLAGACALTPPCTVDFLHSEQGLAVAKRLQTQ